MAVSLCFSFRVCLQMQHKSNVKIIFKVKNYTQSIIIHITVLASEIMFLLTVLIVTIYSSDQIMKKFETKVKNNIESNKSSFQYPVDNCSETVEIAWKSLKFQEPPQRYILELMQPKTVTKPTATSYLFSFNVASSPGKQVGHTFLHVQFPDHGDYICGSWEGIHGFRCRLVTNFRQKIWNAVLRTIRDNDLKKFLDVFLEEKESKDALEIMYAKEKQLTGFSLGVFYAQSKPFILAEKDMDECNLM